MHSVAMSRVAQVSFTVGIVCDHVPAACLLQGASSVRAHTTLNAHLHAKKTRNEIDHMWAFLGGGASDTP